MSLLSLERYLYNTSKPTTPGAAASPSFSYLELATRTISAIRRCVFTGESFGDLSEDLETLRSKLQVESEQDGVSQHAVRVEQVLEAFQQRTRDANRERANDFKNVLDILNEAFTQLNSGSETSSTRLKRLEAGLNRAAKIEDLATLRGHLTNMLQFVREEGAKDESQSRSNLESLGKQIRQAHATSSRFSVQLPSRLEALELLTAELANADTAASLHVALFSFDSLRALRVRHGDEVATNILEELARKNIPALVSDGKVFCWSPTTILLVWHHNDHSVGAGDIPHQLKSPVEHRAFIGSRIATFNLTFRSVVMQAASPLVDLIGALDRFCSAGPAC